MVMDKVREFLEGEGKIDR